MTLQPPSASQVRGPGRPPTSPATKNSREAGEALIHRLNGRRTHWLAYACWPVALIHGLGTGSDAKSAWMLGLTAACVLVVLTAVAARISAGWPEHMGARGAAIAASVAAPIGLLIWLPTGPLAPRWAARAGTPRSLLPAASTRLISTVAAGGMEMSSSVVTLGPA